MDEKAVAEFISVTNSTRGTAIRCLSKAGGDVEQAISLFFEDGNTSSVQASAAGNSSRRSARPSGGVRSLGDIGREDSGDDKDTNDYYVGGEKSGQLVQGPPGRSDGPGSAIENLFDRARESGALDGRPEDLPGGQQSSSFRSFTGRAHTLSGVSTEVPGSEENGGPEDRNVVITFYADGVFTVDDGEPRRMDEPQNAQFMRAIMNGQCPPELIPQDPRQMVNLNLVRKGEEYVPPEKPKYTVFSGAGHKLTKDDGDQQEVQEVDNGDFTRWKGPDESLPTTSVQIRLADGGRLIAKFNPSQTVGDIRMFLLTTKPDLPRNFRLTTSFPTRDLVDNSETIEAAGLGGSVVFQK